MNFHHHLREYVCFDHFPTTEEANLSWCITAKSDGQCLVIQSVFRSGSDIPPPKKKKHHPSPPKKKQNRSGVLNVPWTNVKVRNRPRIRPGRGFKVGPGASPCKWGEMGHLEMAENRQATRVIRGFRWILVLHPLKVQGKSAKWRSFWGPFWSTLCQKQIHSPLQREGPMILKVGTCKEIWMFPKIVVPPNHPF